ncbi:MULTISPECIES: iron uptake transporter permease EfeU [unclassified Leucobacter]|uniref:iron uptake transporter permease EfeU n=1 Tax=unclassified Leucobacter TaxID=2621730 RepID=UPI000B13D52A|nr:iron uptake transporter permease EfeU [Leucobacter sp. Ag1]
MKDAGVGIASANPSDAHAAHRRIRPDISVPVHPKNHLTRDPRSMLGTFLIGLREGLEAALIVGILIAYARKLDRKDVVVRIWLGVGVAIGISLAVGAILTYGAYGLSFRAQEIIGGSLSLLAVVMVTWMIMWMARASRSMSGELRGRLDAVIGGTGWGIVAVALLSVGREGIETALFIWATTRATGTGALLGFLAAVAGILVAAALGWAISRGLLRIGLSRFFRWSGAILVVFTAGVLAYAIHDLQEAAVLPGPFAPVPPGAGAFVASWYGESAWAFQLSHVIAPDGWLGVILKGTLGFSPDMTKLEVLVWALYLIPTLTWFLLRTRPQPATGSKPAPAEPAEPTVAPALS